MEVKGYKYTTEQEAIDARTACANYYGLPTEPGNETIYWVNYENAEFNDPIFWYIVFDESIEIILGQPNIFQVTI